MRRTTQSTVRQQTLPTHVKLLHGDQQCWSSTRVAGGDRRWRTVQPTGAPTFSHGAQSNLLVPQHCSCRNNTSANCNSQASCTASEPADAIVDSSKRRAPHFAHATWAGASLCCVLHLSLLRLRLCLPVFIRVVCMSHGATRTIQVC